MKKYEWEDLKLKRKIPEDLEERMSKKRALELFDSGMLEKIEIGTIKGLCQVHKFLFQDIFEEAGEIRKHNISKGNTRFCDVRFLEMALNDVDKMPETSFEEIIEKYVEMNMCHPFYEGNGRATRIWLDRILIKNLKKCVDWEKIDTKEYLDAMERSVVNTREIRTLIQENLTTDIGRIKYLQGINQSYKYEGMNEVDIINLNNKK